MNKKRWFLLVIILIGIWYFWGRGWYANNGEQKAEEPVKSEEVVVNEEIMVSAGQGDILALSNQASVHYFTKSNLESCSTETSVAVHDIDAKYGHPMAGALVAMTQAPFEGMPGDYMTALLPGTRLLSVNIDKDGKATADFNGMLNKDLGECRAAQRRAQIENTIKEFSKVKQIQITVEGSPWQ